MENGETGFFSYAFATSLQPALLQYHNTIHSTHLYPGTKRVELSSLLGLLLLIQYLQYQTSITHPVKVATSSTYLSKFVEDIQYLPPQHQLKIHKQDNYDLISAISYLYLKLHHPITLYNNPSITSIEDECIIDGKTLQTELRDLCYSTATTPFVPTQHEPTSSVSLWSQNTLIHSHLYDILHEYTFGPSFWAYITAKAQWESHVFDTVDWIALRYYLQN